MLCDQSDGMQVDQTGLIISLLPQREYFPPIQGGSLHPSVKEFLKVPHPPRGMIVSRLHRPPTPTTRAVFSEKAKCGS